MTKICNNRPYTASIELCFVDKFHLNEIQNTVFILIDISFIYTLYGDRFDNEFLLYLYPLCESAFRNSDFRGCKNTFAEYTFMYMTQNKTLSIIFWQNIYSYINDVFKSIRRDSFYLS